MLHTVLTVVAGIWGLGAMTVALLRTEAPGYRERTGNRFGAWSGLVAAGCLIAAEVGSAIEAHRRVDPLLVGALVLVIVGYLLMLTTRRGAFARSRGHGGAARGVSTRAASLPPFRRASTS